MVTYSYDHIHLRSREPMETAQYFNKMVGAGIKESIQSDGQSRVDIDINGLIIFIAQAEAFEVRLARRSKVRSATV